MTVFFIVLPLLGCLPTDNDNGQNDNPFVPDLEIQEAEPNNHPTTAQATGLANVNNVRVNGSIADAEDIDVYELGPLSAGDRLTVDLDASVDELDASVVLFDTDSDKNIGTLFAANDDGYRDPSGIDPYLDEVIRHSSQHYHLAIEALHGTLLEAGAYEVKIVVERGKAVPQPQRQTILIDFDGGSSTASSGQAITVASFDASSIDINYQGQTQTIKNAIIATVKENFAGFGADILNTDEDVPPADGSYSTVFIGQVGPDNIIDESEGLGMALYGTDSYNKNNTDNAVVFPASFGLSALGILTSSQLGLAIGNVASHEAGHLLGLNHVLDPSSLMNTFDSPQTLLLDQRFKRSTIHLAIFDSMSLFLTQDAGLLLAETIGYTYRTADSILQTGDTPFTVIPGDLDRDNDNDLAVANRYSDDVSILINHGNATFARADNVNIGAGSTDVIAFDADGDGDWDLLTANPPAQTMTRLVNNGVGGFVAHGTYVSGGDRPISLATADFDNDSDPDVVVVNYYSNSVSVLSNDGGGNLQTSATYSVGEWPLGVTAANLNGDSGWDLIVTNFLSNDISLLLNNGDGTFADAVQTTAGSKPTICTAADLDGDGDNDLAVANYAPTIFKVQYISNVSVLINQGDGSFESPVDYFVGSSAEWITSADLDGDGDIDLAVASSGDLSVPQDTGNLSVLMNKGDGTFAQNVAYQTQITPGCVAAADLDADNDLDLVVANRDSDSLSVYLNNGSGSFGVPVQWVNGN
jgi:hypothetical protein